MALRKDDEGPMDLEGGRKISSETVKLTDLMMPERIKEATEKNTISSCRNCLGGKFDPSSSHQFLTARNAMARFMQTTRQCTQRILWQTLTT
jgi:hypothetical protein